jgi:NADPH-dependent 2,4-dienoyl-CoA reductase/sulfur reductase-like enzyme
VASIDERSGTLNNGMNLRADLVVVSVSVHPSRGGGGGTGLANRGILVDEYLRSSAPPIFAAGDIACWPDALTGERIRVEHFVVAERPGQTAARNIPGCNERFAAVPFF